MLAQFNLLDAQRTNAPAETVTANTQGSPAGVTVVTTRHSMMIAGKKIDYSAHTGYLHLKNDTGKLIAKVFFYLFSKTGR